MADQCFSDACFFSVAVDAFGLDLSVPTDLGVAADAFGKSDLSGDDLAQED